jgi:hypothetical protein
MSNISTLTNAGLIAASTTFSQADQNTIESLSADEVSALISISQKVSLDFLSRNCGSSSPAAAPTTHPVGIVF